MQLKSIRIILHLLKENARNVMTRVTVDVGEKGQIIAKNSAKLIVRRNVHKEGVLVPNLESAVIYFVQVAVQVQHKKNVWPVEIFMMMENANKNVPPCKFTTLPIIYG